MRRALLSTIVSPVSPMRLANWVRKGYPHAAPGRGHCYLVALHGGDHASR